MTILIWIIIVIIKRSFFIFKNRQAQISLMILISLNLIQLFFLHDLRIWLELRLNNLKIRFDIIYHLIKTIGSFSQTSYKLIILFKIMNLFILKHNINHHLLVFDSVWLIYKVSKTKIINFNQVSYLYFLIESLCQLKITFISKSFTLSSIFYISFFVGD